MIGMCRKINCQTLCPMLVDSERIDHTGTTNRPCELHGHLSSTINDTCYY